MTDEPESQLMSKIGREAPASPAKIVEQSKEPHQAGKAPTSEKIRASSCLKYGIKGEVAQDKVAANLGTPTATASDTRPDQEVRVWLSRPSSIELSI